MSHFSVACFFNPEETSLEELLEPYWEELEVEQYVYMTREQILEEGNEIKKEEENRYNADVLKTKTDDELIEAVCKHYGWELNEDGNVYSSYNPNSKWDWYSVGGRFRDKIKLKSGEKVNAAFVKEIDFSLDEEIYNKVVRFWEVYIEKQPLKEGENEKDFTSFYTEEYYLEYFKDKETFAKIHASFNTFAVILPDGTWCQKGEMGWFGCSSETAEESLNWNLNYKERFIDSMDPNLMLVVVDCHI